LNFHHLTVFDAVAQEKSVGKAGRRLRISQPAVSKQLQLLEHALGTKLVDRLPRGVRLTTAGQLLAGYARRVLKLAEEAEHAIADLEGLRAGTLIVGASTTIGTYFLPELLARYRKLHPHVDLSLEVANTHVIQRYLHERRVDVALTEGFVHMPELQAHEFLRDELIAILPPRHSLTRESPVHLKRFCQEPLLMREQGSGTREVIEEALRKNGIEIRPLMTLGSTEAIKRSVAAGVGVSFVSSLTIRQELHDGRLATVPLGGFRLKRALHVVQARDQSASAAVRAFLDLLGRTGSFHKDAEEHGPTFGRSPSRSRTPDGA
jgi:DNA-binding transcriptional LysR family regulator